MKGGKQTIGGGWSFCLFWGGAEIGKEERMEKQTEGEGGGEKLALMRGK